MFTRPRQSDYREFDGDNNEISFQVLDMDGLDCYEKPLDRTTEYCYRVFLFGVTKKGQSITCMVKGFQPFFYIRVPSKWNMDDARSYVNSISSSMKNKYFRPTITINTHKDIWGFQNNERRKFIRLAFNTYSQYYSATKAVSATRPPGLSGSEPFVYETDDVLLKFIHATKIRSWVQVTTSERIDNKANFRTCLSIQCKITDLTPIDSSTLAPILQCSVDIEVNGSTEKFPDPNIKDDVIFNIASVFKRYGEDDFCYKHCLIIGDIPPIEGVVVECCKNERDLLVKWINMVEETDPDIFISYNGDCFDFNFLYVRARVCGLQQEFGRGLSRIAFRTAKVKDSTFQTNATGTRNFKRLITYGRLNFDLLVWVRKNEKLVDYKLNTVAATWIMETKDDMSVRELFAAYRTKDPEQLHRVAKYCVQDTLLPQKIVDKRNIWPTVVEFAKATCVPISYYFTRGEQVKAYSQIMGLALEMDYRIPCIDGTSQDDNELQTENGKKFVGATVLEPEIGIHWDPISVLDFASLYPSIIRAFNFCYSTFVRDKRYDNIPGVDYHSVDLPTGTVKFVQNQESILPILLKRLAIKRKETKAMMKKVNKQSDPLTYIVLDAKQLAFKLSMNSVYGFLGAHTLPLVEISACVTTEGRKMLEETKRTVEEKWKGHVVYGDTDSVFVKFDPTLGMNMHELFEWSDKCAQDVTSRFKHPNELEFEKVYHPLMLLAKKKYIGKKYTTPDVGEVEKKGIQTEQKDTCEFLVALLNTIVKGITDGFDKKDKLYKQICGVIDTRLTQFLRPDFDPKLVSLSKKWDGNKNSSHRLVGEKMRARGELVENGDKIRFVYVLGRHSKDRLNASDKGEELEYVMRQNDKTLTLPLDKKYYIENVFRNAISKLIAPLSNGLTEQEVAKSQLFQKHIRAAEAIETRWWQTCQNSKKRALIESFYQKSKGKERIQ